MSERWVSDDLERRAIPFDLAVTGHGPTST